MRFRYPRWMYDGPAICGISVEASRGFLRGWYAQNSVSLKHPRLGYVCVSEDLTGHFGLCGYFKEYDHDLTEDERLAFAPDERPPAFDPAAQPAPPDEHWSEERLAKASRNYAVEYCRNGIRELSGVIGSEAAIEIGKRAARLTGLQQFSHMAGLLVCEDGGVSDAAAFLAEVLAGMGDTLGVEFDAQSQRATVDQKAFASRAGSRAKPARRCSPAGSSCVAERSIHSAPSMLSRPARRP